jgi:hypothetical protein
VSAEAVGGAHEGMHFPELLDKTLKNLNEVSVKTPGEKKPVFLGDANYFSENNLRACQAREVEAIIPDGRHRKRLSEGEKRRYEAFDFEYHEEGDNYVCPNGKMLEYKRTQTLGGEEGKIYQASAADCRQCPLNARCIKTDKDLSKLKHGRQIMIKKSNEPGSLSTEMKKKLATEEYQNQYAYRIQIIEPVFANITYCKGLDRFTLRGKNKVNGQWKLYCIVHNLGKCLAGYNEKRKVS